MSYHFPAKEKVGEYLSQLKSKYNDNPKSRNGLSQVFHRTAVQKGLTESTGKWSTFFKVFTWEFYDKLPLKCYDKFYEKPLKPIY